MADGQPLVGQAEQRLAGQDEGGQAQRMNLDARAAPTARAARRPGPDTSATAAPIAPRIGACRPAASASSRAVPEGASGFFALA